MGNSKKYRKQPRSTSLRGARSTAQYRIKMVRNETLNLKANGLDGLFGRTFLAPEDGEAVVSPGPDEKLALKRLAARKVITMRAVKTADG